MEGWGNGPTPCRKTRKYLCVWENGWSIDVLLCFCSSRVGVLGTKQHGWLAAGTGANKVTLPRARERGGREGSLHALQIQRRKPTSRGRQQTNSHHRPTFRPRKMQNPRERTNSLQQYHPVDDRCFDIHTVHMASPEFLRADERFMRGGHASLPL